MARKRNASIRNLLFTFFFVTGQSVFGATSVDSLTGTVNPNEVNHYGSYTINFRIANNIGVKLESNIDYIIITFDGAITVPASIPLSSVTVNGAIPNSISIFNNEVTILTPVDIPRAGWAEVVFGTPAGIKNPSTPGNYWIETYTNKQFLPAMISPLLTIVASTSTVTQATVTPNPSIASEAAAYNISFNLGSGGALAAGSGQVSILFPSDTYVPSGSISGVTVNSTSASASASGDTVFITTPIDIDNDGAVILEFALGAGLINPPVDGNYNINVKTSSEPTEVSSYGYAISPAGQLSITAISSYPDTVNQVGEFVFDLRTGSSGALSSDADSIYIVMPTNTLVPSSIVSSNISVTSGGFSDDAVAVEILAHNYYTDDDTIVIVPNISIGNSSDVTITLKNSAGIGSPSIAGAYKIKIKTSAEPAYVESNPYTVFGTISTVSNANVTPHNATPFDTASYTVNFNAGRYGRLYSGNSTMTISFNSAHTLFETSSTHYDSSTINIGGAGAINIPPANISASNTTKEVIITVPANAEILNNDNIEIILDGANKPIINPAGGNYSLQVNTSVESSPVTSNLYNIGGTEITINSVTLTESNVNNSSGYTFNISILTEMYKIVNDNIVIIFPEGTILPASILSSQVSIKGLSASSVVVNQGTRTVTAMVNAKYTPGDSPFDVAINAAAGITNPIIPGNTYYKATMYTSKDQAPVISSPYSLSGNDSSLTIVSTQVLPSVINANPAKYIFDFTTSGYGQIAGGLSSGSSTITFNFDTSTIVPLTIDPSTVSVNSNASQAVNVLSSGNAGSVEVIVPSGLTIGNNSAVNLVFDYTAGLANDSIAGIQNVGIFSSSDTVSAIASFDLSTSQDLTFTSVTPNPTTQNANASYSVKFTTGSLGALAAGEQIIITFPDNTYLPVAMDKNDIAVNGTALAVNPSIAGQVLTINSPVDIGGLVLVTVLINQAAGILNPSIVNSYTLDLSTTVEAGPFTSPAYNITQTSSTVSAASVSLGSGLTSAITNYTINFNMGSGGRLISSSSAISIEFNANTTVSTDTINNYDLSTISINSGPVQSLRGYFSAISGQIISITVPPGVSISNDDNINILFSGSAEPITNPAISGDYTLKIKTSVENTYITSNTYAVSNVGPVTVSNAALNPQNANATAAYTVDFNVTSQLTANSGTMTFTFPDNTLIPTTIATSAVIVNTNQSFAVLTNPTNRTITVTTPITLNGAVQVIISAGAGIENPSATGNYTLQVATSAQPIQSTSPQYLITPTDSSVTITNIDILPNTPSTLAQFTMNFTTSDNGRMVSGASSIYVIMPVDASFTQGVPATSKILINSTAAKSVTLYNGNAADADTIVAVVPNSVTVGNGSSVTFVIDSTAGFQTPSSASSLTYQAYTSVDNIIESLDYSLPVELASFSASSRNSGVYLTWVTESELNNALWVLERIMIDKNEFDLFRENGSTPNEGYQLLAEVEGMGTVSTKTEYEYMDNSVDVGSYYIYRISDIAYDGNVTSHNPVVVEVMSPSEFILEQNYPNPFNPSTTVSFSLPGQSKVSLIVYDVLGREVYRVIDKQLIPAGNHEIQWAGKNKAGQQVASGIYFYRIQANNFSAIRKMILLK